jgi:hypothetical protein
VLRNGKNGKSEQREMKMGNGFVLKNQTLLERFSMNITPMKKNKNVLDRP